MTRTPRFNRSQPALAVPMGLHLEEDGWWTRCPEHDWASGPHPERPDAARARARHLAEEHATQPLT